MPIAYASSSKRSTLDPWANGKKKSSRHMTFNRSAARSRSHDRDFKLHNPHLSVHYTYSAQFPINAQEDLRLFQVSESGNIVTLSGGYCTCLRLVYYLALERYYIALAHQLNHVMHRIWVSKYYLMHVTTGVYLTMVRYLPTPSHGASPGCVWRS